ncbi:MAG: pitrilysin family protein [Patescibacteria group bacterium]|nr:pitrilysin family protein [Patescibacteria group bacterium]
MDYKKTTLKNGLRIITVPSKNTKTAAVLVLVGTGSKYETKNINGISHFLEHMFFKGTKRYPSTLKLIEPLDKIGGQYNAFTSEEYTGYWAKVDASHLDLALDWVSDIYLNSKLEQEEINREKGTILQELNMYLDMPMRYVGNLWTNLLYGNQPAGWLVLGTEEMIKKAKRHQFVKYLKEHYSSQNTIVAVAGNINSAQTIRKVKKCFQAINNQAVENKLPVEEKQTEPKSLIHYKKTDQTHLHLGVRGYDIFHPDKYALNLISVILGGNMSSRLWISVRERQGLAYYIGTSIDSSTDTGSLITRAGVDNQKAERAIKIILDEYRKIASIKISQAELRKAKDYIKGSSLISMEASDEKASFAAFQELLTGKILTLEQKLAKIEAVTVNDIQRVAQDIFRPEKLNLALIGPFKDKAKFEKLLANNK